MRNQSIIHIPRPGCSKFRLLCFPYAGGNSRTYSSWINNIHPDVELAFIEMPGRGRRFCEKPCESMAELIDELYSELIRLPNKDLIFIGHSMGARVAYELAVQMHKKSRSHLPILFIASASPAPNISNNRYPMSKLSDAQLIEKLYQLGGVEQSIIDNVDLMELLLPAIRADFKLIENYRSLTKKTLPINLVIFSGRQDSITEAEIAPWFSLFDNKVNAYKFDGGHFFIDSNPEVIVRLNEIIEGFRNERGAGNLLSEPLN